MCVNIVRTFVTKVCEVVMGWVDFVESSVFHPEYEYVVQYSCTKVI